MATIYSKQEIIAAVSKIQTAMQQQGINNPYFTMRFAEGEVYGTLDDLSIPRVFKSMTRKLGQAIDVIPFDKDESYLDKYRVTYIYYENSQRKKAYRKRMKLKELFPKHRGILKLARQISQKEFLQKLPDCDKRNDFKRQLKKVGFKDEIHFWRVCRYSHYEIPNPQKELTMFM